MKRLRQAGRFGLRVVVPIVRVCWMVATSPLWLIAIFEHFGREVPWEDYHWFPFRYLWRKGVGQWTRTLRPLWDSCADVEVETMDDRSTLLRGEPAPDTYLRVTFFLEGVPVYQRRSESHYRGIVIPWDDPDPAQRVIEGLEARAKAEDEEERVKDDTSFYPNYKTLRRDLEAAERVPLVYAGVVIDWNAPDPVMMLLRELQARGLTRPYPPDLAPEPEGKVWKEAFSRCLTQYGDATDGSILKGRR